MQGSDHSYSQHRKQEGRVMDSIFNVGDIEYSESSTHSFQIECMQRSSVGNDELIDHGA